MGWTCGNPHDYNREYCVDLIQLAAFLRGPPSLNPAESLSLSVKTAPPGAGSSPDSRAKSPSAELSTCCGTALNMVPTIWTSSTAPLRPTTRRRRQRFEQNRFSVTRQLRYSRDETQRALDIGLFINGLPVFTFELKNNLTKQTVDDAV